MTRCILQAVCSLVYSNSVCVNESVSSLWQLQLLLRPLSLQFFPSRSRSRCQCHLLTCCWCACQHNTPHSHRMNDTQTDRQTEQEICFEGYYNFVSLVETDSQGCSAEGHRDWASADELTTDSLLWVSEWKPSRHDMSHIWHDMTWHDMTIHIITYHHCLDWRHTHT